MKEFMKKYWGIFVGFGIGYIIGELLLQYAL